MADSRDEQPEAAGKKRAEELQEKLSSLVRLGIQEGKRFAVSTQIWRNAREPSVACDVLLLLPSSANEAEKKKRLRTARAVADLILEHEPTLSVEVVEHRLGDRFAIYVAADDFTLMRGAELCQLQKRVSDGLGGGFRPFVVEESACFVGSNDVSWFFSSRERASIVRQLLEHIRAPEEGRVFDLEDEVDEPIRIPAGAAILTRLLKAHVLSRLQPLHDGVALRQLEAEWLLAGMTGSQPLDGVYDYFGAEIALYFGWLAHMTRALCAPALLGVAIFLFGGSGSGEGARQENCDYSFVAFALFNCVWTTVYLEHWKRRQAELAFKWATLQEKTLADDLLTEPRPQFKGEYLVANAVTGQLEPYYPAWKKACFRYAISYPLTAFCLLLLFFAMITAFRAQALTEFYFGGSLAFGWLCYLPMVIFSLLMQISDRLYRRLALTLNEFENHRSEEHFENFLITKIVLFNVISNFGALFYTAFFMQDMHKLRETLATLLITRQLVQNCSEVVVPFVLQHLKLSAMTYRMTRQISLSSLTNGKEEETTTSSFPLLSSPDSECRRRHQRPSLEQDNNCEQQLSDDYMQPEGANGEDAAVADCLDVTRAEIESLMEPYERPLDDYLEMFIQFGYVILFSPAFPLAAFFAVANNVLEMRVDAFKLCRTVQRPFARAAASIGSWQTAMEMLGTLGVIVNAALIAQSRLLHRAFPSLSWEGEMLFVLAVEHCLLGVRGALGWAVPEVPEWVRVECGRRELRRREMLRASRRPQGISDASARH